jgi:hypothetical protein
MEHPFDHFDAIPTANATVTATTQDTEDVPPSDEA